MNTKLLTPTAMAFVVGIALTATVFMTLDFGDRTSIEDQRIEKRVLYWVASMDPNYRRSGPGKSLMGMNLIPVYADRPSQNDGDQAGSVTISPAMLQNLGVRTASVERRDLTRIVRTVGHVTADETLISHVHVRAEGWIERLPVKVVGERVKKGQTLFELYAPDIHVAQGEFLQFLNRGETDMLEITLDRLSLLDVPESEIQALRNGGPVKRRTSILSPLDGVVLSLNVGEGMFVRPDVTTMIVADLSTVWVLANIFEDQASWVQPGLPATLTLTYQPGVTRAGVVDYIYPIMDSKTRTLTARLRFDNPDGALKPNMFADVEIQSPSTPNVLVVPLEALIRTGGSDRVVLALDEGRFKSIEVTAGQEAEGFVEIFDGVSLSDEVVVSGQFLIDSESSLSGAIRRMGPNNDGAFVSEAAP